MPWRRASRKPEIRRLSATEFHELLPAAFRIFADAMAYPDSFIEPRIRLAVSQLSYAGFTAFAAHDRGQLIGFAHGYRVQPGQWWADEVSRALEGSQADRSRDWLADAFELCEIHVSPEAQGRGAGRALLRAISDAQPFGTIVLSTPTGPTKAAALYAAEGYSVIAPRFRFSGDPRDFDILARVLRGG